MKRRITIPVDDDERKRRGFAPVPDNWWKLTGVTVEKVEGIPDPDRVQEFRVRVVTPADLPAWTSDRLDGAVRFVEHMAGGTDVIVTEVDPTEVPS